MADPSGNRRMIRHEPRELRPRQLLAEHDRPVRSSAVCLEHVLCQIDPDDANFSHGCLLLQLVIQHRKLGTLRCRLGRAASTPSPFHSTPYGPDKAVLFRNSILKACIKYFTKNSFRICHNQVCPTAIFSKCSHIAQEQLSPSTTILLTSSSRMRSNDNLF